MKKKKALFFINSLSNGGAERVCANLTKEMIREGFDVDYIILGENTENSNNYSIGKNVNVLNLNINTKNRLLKLLKTFYSIGKVNKYIKTREKSGKYDIITSHLPTSNILTRLSKASKKAIYVFHTNMSHYGKKENRLFNVFLKIIFNKRKVVTVSKGMMDECVNDYGFNSKYITTIYNPISFDEIDQLKNEKINFNDKYFLQVGRFNNEKRQDRMLKIFKEGNYYPKYKLVFCGTGANEEKIKQMAKKMKMDEMVYFAGWQSNIFKWMKNCEILISCSDNEGFPMNLIEAYYCNTKVVAADCKFGPNEILINDFKRFLVKDKENISEYIDKINMALDNYPKMKNNIIEKCKVNNVVKKYVDFSNMEV